MLIRIIENAIIRILIETPPNFSIKVDIKYLLTQDILQQYFQLINSSIGLL